MNRLNSHDNDFFQCAVDVLDEKRNHLKTINAQRIEKEKRERRLAEDSKPNLGSRIETHNGITTIVIREIEG